MKLITILMTLFATSLFAETFTVDNVHSFAHFKIGHNKVGFVHGRFNHIEGTFKFDESTKEFSNITLKIEVESVDTKVKARDEHLKTADFFNVSLYPSITFTSTSVKKVSDSEYVAEGLVSIHGIEKKMKIPFSYGGVYEKVVGIDSTFSLKRTDFGMNYPLDLIADLVEINVSIEALK